MAFTVNEFANRTGLPASTLRFYDRKELLTPAKRLPNGYREYAESQITEALMIHSLRQADVPMEDIRNYMQAEQSERDALIRKWRREIDAKLTNMQIAKQYLNGIRPDETMVKLLRWDECSVMVWFRCTVEQKPDPFAAVREQCMRRLENYGISFHHGIYVRILDAKGGRVTGEVGFRLSDDSQIQVPELIAADASVKMIPVPQMLFVTMDCLVGNDLVCFDFIHLMRKYGFTAAGSTWERYDPDNKRVFQMLIPVISKT